MIYCLLPVGNVYGWGVCGRNLLRQLARLTEVVHVHAGFTVDEVGAVDEYRFLMARQLPPEDAARLVAATTPWRVAHPALHAIQGRSLRPANSRLIGQPNVGYTFFEEELAEDAAAVVATHFDRVVAGSRWCEERLRERGVENVHTVIQGIDPEIFHPGESPAHDPHDTGRFTIFSGGKLELRKGQDLVMRAVAVLQARHPDVHLVTAWWNPWDFSRATLAASPHIGFDAAAPPEEALPRAMAEAGLDLARVTHLGPLPNTRFAAVYRASDVGLFPNRCEGGTNLVLMEYMACGKPAIATYGSGHRDVLDLAEALRLERLTPLVVQGPHGVYARWQEPDLEEIVEQLEWAYHHREALWAIGERAGHALARLTWQRTAEELLALLEP